MLQNMYQKHRIFVVQYPGPQNIKLQLFQGSGLGRRLATRDKGGYSFVSCPVFILICSCCKNSAQKDWKQERHSGAENQNESSLLTSFAINSFHRSSGRARSAPAGHTVPARGSLKQELNQQMGVIGCYWALLPRCPTSHASTWAANLVWETVHLARLTLLLSSALESNQVFKAAVALLMQP